MKLKNKLKKMDKKFLITTGIVMIGQAVMYWLVKEFQSNPIYINYYLDDKIPFLGHFIYIYDLYYPFSFLALFLLYQRDEKNYFKTMISLIMACLICDIIFLTMPTIMYRPVTPNYDVITNFILKVTFFFDDPPLNCFPSTHCIFCFQIIFSFTLSKHVKKIRIPVIIFALLIVLSTLFIKQHFIYDIVAAFLICLIANLLENTFDIYQRIKKKYFNKKI